MSTRPVKRPRTTFSCQTCRASKIKCDKAEKPVGSPCTPCEMRGRACISQSDDADTSTSSATLLNFAHQISPPLNASTSKAVVPKQKSTSSVQGRDRDDDKIYDMLVEIKGLLLTNQRQHTGSPDSASVGYEPNAGEFPSHMVSKRFLVANAAGQLTDDIACYVLLRPALAMLPSKDVLDQLITTFFAEGQVLEEYIDEKSFRSRWLTVEMARQHAQDPLYTFDDAVTLSTCFVALSCNLLYLSHKHPSILALHAEIGESFDPTTQSDVYMATSRWIMAKAQFERASAAINAPGGQSIFCIPPPGLDQLEMLLVEVQNLCYSKVNTEAIWKRVVMCVTMALDLRLHSKDGHGPTAKPEDVDRRRRLFFHVFTMDKYASMMGGRPALLQQTSYDVPLPQTTASSSQAEKFLEMRARYGKLLAEWVGYGGSQPPHHAVKRLIRETELWWARCGEMGLAATQMELTSHLLNHQDREVHARGRRQMHLYANYSHMMLHLTRHYCFVDDSDLTCDAERKRSIQCAQDIVQLFTMIVSIWQMLSAEQRDLLPLTTILSWSAFAAFDSILIIMWVLCGKPAGSERDSFISLIVSCRNTYAYAGDNSVKVGLKAVAVIDTLLPFVSTTHPDESARKKQRTELAEMLQSVLAAGGRSQTETASSTSYFKGKDSPQSLTPSHTFTSTPSSHSTGESPHDMPLSDPFLPFDSNMFSLGLSWQSFIDQAAINQPFI